VAPASTDLRLMAVTPALSQRATFLLQRKQDTDMSSRLTGTNAFFAAIEPLEAEDIADGVAYMVTRPRHTRLIRSDRGPVRMKAQHDGLGRPWAGRRPRVIDNMMASVRRPSDEHNGVT
jgi:hypothetical protein